MMLDRIVEDGRARWTRGPGAGAYDVSHSVAIKGDASRTFHHVPVSVFFSSVSPHRDEYTCSLLYECFFQQPMR